MSDFPARIYVVAATEDGAVSLHVAYFPEDWEQTEHAGEPVAVYELKSVGRNEPRFVEGTK